MLLSRAGKVEEDPVRTTPKIDPEALAAIAPATLEDSFVYVHCHYYNAGQETLIRIWKSTYLIDKSAGARSSLVHAENISYAPVWTQVRANSEFSFLLVFEGLPKACKQFDLVEEITQPGGFEVRNISRNEADVYHIRL